VLCPVHVASVALLPWLRRVFPVLVSWLCPVQAAQQSVSLLV
jgi:hypothetical protein